ncbi:LamG-like jellyroll fold domain-containing protein [Chitinophaga sp. sic0106]|uniref:Ig-like domain-containing protein n=1 Tax=Chitinophaga sp. sic0106 TaxID=2854785 RepID=UPI001C465914|nr:LamG-like jellyroll fold domain-containing protein [Chitinophaga sp. sic0106]MBV7532441.1 T9SS type A sorting domain-containing protein [Chitinophaga sp. sic0106]
MKQNYPNKLAAAVIAAVFGMLLFDASLAKAQTYANSQSTAVTGICLLCGVTNPGNAVDSNLTNYSEFQITAALLGVTVSQDLIFSDLSNAGCDSLIIRIGSGNATLSVALFGAVTVQTYNGTTGNNDAQTVSSPILRLLQNNTIAEITLKPSQAFDRVRLTVNSSLLGLLNNFRIYYALKKSVAPTAPTVSPSAATICAGSSITYTASSSTGSNFSWYDASVGGNLLSANSTYSISPLATDTVFVQVQSGGCASLRTPVVTSVTPLPDSFTLSSPATVCKDSSAIITVNNPQAGVNYNWYTVPAGGSSIYTGNAYTPPPVDSIQTFYVEAVNSSTGCIQGRVAVTVRDTLCKISHCGTFPSDYFNWYPFNGNGNDSSANHINGTQLGNVSFALDSICDQAATFNNGGFLMLQGTSAIAALPTSKMSVAFWIHIDPTAEPFTILNGGYVTPVGVPYGWQIEYDGYGITLGGTIDSTNAIAGTPVSTGRWHHLVLTYDSTNISAYLDGNLQHSVAASGTWTYFDYRAALYAIGLEDSLGRGSFTANGVKLEDLLVYKRALSASEVTGIYDSYSFEHNPAAPFAATSIMNKGTDLSLPTTNLKLFPNPTTGRISLPANFGWQNARVLVRDFQGRVVKNEKLERDNFTINAPNGLYLVTIYTGKNQVYQSKVILAK